jgi:hypothetical protein
MPAKGDDVAEKIESQVREAITKMVSDIRSSIEDVKEVVNQQLQAAMQSVQADANSLSLRSQLQQTLRDFGGGSGAAISAPAPAKASAADIGPVKRAIQAVERGTSQIDVLNALLDQSLNFGTRAALFILKGDTFTGWKGAGFSAHGGNDEAVKRFSAASSSIPELDRMFRQERVVQWNGGSLASRLGASSPQQGVLIPMVIKDKVAAALYVDGDSSRLNRSALELLVFTTGLLIDTLSIRKKIPSPTLSAEDSERTLMADEPVSATPERTFTAPRPSPMAPPPRPAPASPPPPPRPSPPRQFEMDSESAPARRSDSFATTAIPAFTASPQPAPKPAAPPPPQPVATASPDIVEKTSTQYIPPAGLKGGARFGQPQSEDTKKHDEARRFARLLVSEIKLYNESKVDQGRRNKDIYERLKEDIDRSRQMYDERITEGIRKSSNYFYDELVRILADGDSEALGL